MQKEMQCKNNFNANNITELVMRNGHKINPRIKRKTEGEKEGNKKTSSNDKLIQNDIKTEDDEESRPARKKQRSLQKKDESQNEEQYS